MAYTFDDVADIILTAGSMLSPSELHGQVSGQLALGFSPSAHQWLRQISDATGVQIEAGSRVADDLVEWLQEIQNNIADEDLAFSLCLPSDEEGLLAAAEELATWCGGFMTGVAMVNANGVGDKFGEDTQELLEDIMAIATLDPESTVEAEEADLDELVQYVRLGVAQLCLDTINKHKPESSQRMH